MTESTTGTSLSSHEVFVFWIVCVVLPITILVVIIIFAFIIYKCCRNRNSDSRSKSFGHDGYTSLERFPPSGVKKRHMKLSPSSSASTSGSNNSEGYGSLQSQALLLGRHVSSVHEITPAEDIHYLDINDIEPSPIDRGQITVSMSYNQKNGLSITVHEVSNLIMKPFMESIDSYVKIRISSNLHGDFQDFQFQTTVKRKSQNAIFDETFEAELSSKNISDYIAKFEVTNYHKFSRKDVIGEISIPLHDVMITNEITRCYDLTPPQKKFCGEILLSLSYLPTSSRLLLGILEAKHLISADTSRNIDGCVRASVITSGRKCRKKKTSVVQYDDCPVFNEKFFFEIPAERLDRVQILVTVTNELESGADSDTDTGYSDAEIGQVILGHRCTPRAHAHWLKMTENPREKYAQWYYLTA